MASQLRVCFIDDDDRFEIPLFRKVFGGDFDLITATTWGRCRQQIRQRDTFDPQLFILDMHLPYRRPDNGKVKRLARKPLQLRGDQGQLRQAFINHTLADDRLRELIRAHGQGFQGGLRLMRTIKASYPQVPVVFYTRKATLAEAILAIAAGAADVVRKPTAPTDRQTRLLAARRRPRLLRLFKQAAGDRLDHMQPAARTLSNLAKRWIEP